jgi:NitT/TauT family transport system substrate-binding protein
LLTRALTSAGLKESDLTTVNISDADFMAAWSTKDTKAIVAWKPGLSDIQATAEASPVFNSSQIPGEIMDIAMVNTQTLRDNPAFGKAMVGAWYETLAVMQGDSEKAKAARTVMAQASGTDLKGFDTQIATTHLFYKPADAVTFVKAADQPKIMELVRSFAFDHGLMGEGVKDRDAIGIEFADGKTVGNKDNVKLRFDAIYAGMAADGKL